MGERGPRGACGRERALAVGTGGGRLHGAGRKGPLQVHGEAELQLSTGPGGSPRSALGWPFSVGGRAREQRCGRRAQAHPGLVTASSLASGTSWAPGALTCKLPRPAPHL